MRRRREGESSLDSNLYLYSYLGAGRVESSSDGRMRKS
jgi:hypothetical protein